MIDGAEELKSQSRRVVSRRRLFNLPARRKESFARDKDYGVL
jgi:hypothetical protein